MLGWNIWIRGWSVLIYSWGVVGLSFMLVFNGSWKYSFMLVFNGNWKLLVFIHACIQWKFFTVCFKETPQPWSVVWYNIYSTTYTLVPYTAHRLQTTSVHTILYYTWSVLHMYKHEVNWFHDYYFPNNYADMQNIIVTLLVLRFNFLNSAFLRWMWLSKGVWRTWSSWCQRQRRQVTLLLRPSRGRWARLALGDILYHNNNAITLQISLSRNRNM